MATPAQPADPPAVLAALRLSFARWLVETGRLSEWPDAHYRNGVARARIEAQAASLERDGLTLSSAGPGGVQR